MIWCNKAINDAVSIETGVNDTLKLLVDGEEKEVTIPQADYYSNYQKRVSVLVDTIASELDKKSIPVLAKLGGVFGDEDTLRKCVVVFEHKTGGTVELNGGNIETILMNPPVADPDPEPESIV